MIIPVGFAQVTHIFDLLGSDQVANVTYGVALEGVGFGETRVAQLHDAVDDHLLSGTSVEWVLSSTLLKYGPVTSGPLFEFASNIAGRNPGTASPPQVAALIRKRTSLGGRRNRGRMYWPGMIDANVNGIGELLAGYRTGFQTDINAFLAKLNTLEMPMVLLHNNSSDPTPVTALNLDGRIATQRRRLR